MIDVRMNQQSANVLGRLGENEHRRALFDISEYVEMYPNATYRLLNLLPGQTLAYPVDSTTVDGAILYWTITDADLSAEGHGRCELVVMDGDVVAKSEIYMTRVLTALDGSGDAPDPWDSYIEQFEEMKDAAESAADSAAASAADAAASAASSDGAAAQAMIAGAFNVATAYLAGTYVTYTDGKLYRLTADHAADVTWANTSKTAVTAGGELADLRTDFTEYTDYTGYLNLEWAQGGLYAESGLEYDSDNAIRTGYIHVSASDSIAVINPNAREYSVFKYDASKGFLSRLIRDSVVTGRNITIPSGTSYIRFSIAQTSITPQEAEGFCAESIGGRPNAALMASYCYAANVPTGSDLDDVTTPGNYAVASSADAATIDNIPSNVGGRLTVLSLSSANAICQIYTDTNGHLFARQFASGEWTTWSSLDSRYQASLRSSDATSIPQDSDLNDYTAIGDYRISTSAIAATISNIPYNTPGRLVVFQPQGTGPSQLFVGSNGRIFCRGYSGGAWMIWRPVSINESSLVTDSLFTTNIPSGSDFDDFKTPGNYRVESVAVAQTMSHIPEAAGGRLEVLTLAGSGSVCQWYLAASNNWYVRELISNAWSDWKHLVDETYVQGVVETESAARAAYNVLSVLARRGEYDIAFANAFKPLSLKNYLGNAQNVHPKVLYFADGFGGHRYWMAYTPYPYSRDGYENPCIAYSEDGENWTNIPANPIDDPNGNGYDSDTHLVYDSANNRLECWYRYVGPASQSPREETLYRQVSADGVTWSEKELVLQNLSGDYAQYLSPAVILDSGTYKMWVIDNASHAIAYYTAAQNSITSWTHVRNIPLTYTDDGVSVNPWHLDVIQDGGEYIALVMTRNTTAIGSAKCSLFMTKSSDNINYSAPVKVVQGADGWDKYMYRSSIVPVGDRYRIYYSAGSGGTETIYNNAVWGIGVTESESLLTGYFGKYE